jgi:hypothetical protein
MLNAQVAQQILTFISSWYVFAVCCVRLYVWPFKSQHLPCSVCPLQLQFLTALRQIGSLVNLGDSASTNSGGIFGLLNAFQTISSATTSPAAAATSRGLLADSAASESTAVNNLLNAVKTVGNLLVGSSTTSSAAPSMAGLLQSGMGLISSLSKLIPLSGGGMNLNLASILSLLQNTGSFFSQMTALLPSRG